MFQTGRRYESGTIKYNNKNNNDNNNHNNNHIIHNNHNNNNNIILLAGGTRRRSTGAFGGKERGFASLDKCAKLPIKVCSRLRHLSF